MITSKLRSKGRTAVPQPVRAALSLKEGDKIAYQIDGDRVILTKAGAATILAPFAVFEEWNSPADQAAYGNL